MSVDYEQLDFLIKDFKKRELQVYQDRLVSELEKIMFDGVYIEVKKIIKEFGERVFSKRLTEEFIRYLYARLKNKKPRLTLEQLFKIR
jgi:hypothetical protein